MEKPGVLQSMGSKRAGHDLALEQQIEILIRGMEEHWRRKFRIL